MVEPRARAEGTLRVEVHVLDDSRQPIPGIPLRLLTLEENDQRPLSVSRAAGVTGADGSVTLFVGPGKYCLLANFENKTTVALPGDGPFRPDYSAAAEDVVILSEGQEQQIVLLARSAKLELIINDDLGAPVSGIRLQGGDRAAEVVSDENGRALIEPVAAGVEVLARVAEGETGPGKTYSCATPRMVCNAQPNETFVQEFLLVRNASLRLELPAYACGGPARLFLRQISTDTESMQTAHWQLELGESVKVEGVPPGRYGVRCDLQADGACWSPGVPDLTVGAGADLSVSVPITFESRVIAGVVLDWDGRARAGLRVALSDSAAWHKSAVTGEDGRFAIHGAPRVPMTVQVVPYGAPGPEVAYYGTLEQQTGLVDPQLDELVLRVERGYRIRGRVVPAGDAPIKVRIDQMLFRNPVTVQTGQRTEWAQVVEPGAFAFGHLRSGTYRLVSVDDEGQPIGAEQVVEVGAAFDSPQSVDVTVEVDVSRGRGDK